MSEPAKKKAIKRKGVRPPPGAHVNGAGDAREVAVVVDDIEAKVEKLLKERVLDERIRERLNEHELDSIANTVSSRRNRARLLKVLKEYTKAVKMDELPVLLSNDEIMGMPAVDWTVDDWIQESDLTNIYSPAGSGKTLVSESLKEAISHGEPWQGWPTKGGAVFVLSAEGVTMLRARIEAVRKVRKVEDNERSRHTEEAWDVTSIRGLARLVRALFEVERLAGKRVVALLVDPADEYSPESVPEGVEHTKAIALALRSVARGLGVSVVLFHHTNAVGERARGTEHLRMYAAGHIRLDRINDDVIGLVQEKQRNGMERAMKLDIVRTGDSVILSVTQGGGDEDGDYLKAEYLAAKNESIQKAKARGRPSAAHAPALREAIMKLMPTSEPEARERAWSKNQAANSSEAANIATSKGTRGDALNGLIADGFIETTQKGDGRGTIFCWKVRELPNGGMDDE